MIPSVSCSKNQLIADDGPFPQPRFWFLNNFVTSQSQSIALAISRTSLHLSTSSFLSSRGPSAAIYNFVGFIFRIASITFRVVSGLLKIRNNTGVVKGALTLGLFISVLLYAVKLTFLSKVLNL